jgi:hypothetical protein
VLIAVILSAMVVMFAAILGRGALNLKGALLVDEPTDVTVIAVIEPKLSDGVAISDIDFLRKEKRGENALQSVPGLFGTSQVTAEDMRKSQLGIYQPKADEYLRQLSDEVLNGKDWGANVDIKDAAKRAGIDPNLPNDIILELVKEAWNNSSLFAEGKNLDLINTDAVKAAIEQQQKELSGQASLKALFGINDENLKTQSEQLGQGLAAVFGRRRIGRDRDADERRIQIRLAVRSNDEPGNANRSQRRWWRGRRRFWKRWRR